MDVGLKELRFIAKEAAKGDTYPSDSSRLDDTVPQLNKNVEIIPDKGKP